jgi:hypothetical protein
LQKLIPVLLESSQINTTRNRVDIIGAIIGPIPPIMKVAYSPIPITKVSSNRGYYWGRFIIGCIGA